jgi:hypothetical protein
MSKYNLIVRRHAGEDWSAWCNTDDDNVFANSIKVIESYGWRWSLETPMCQKEFISARIANGIDEKMAKRYCKGRTKLTTDDIEILEFGRD